MSWVLDSLAGLAAGVLSGWGIGGGSLLIIYLTNVAAFNQHLAQGINLMFFPPASITALISHIKNGFVSWQAAIPAMITGLVTAGVAAFVVGFVDPEPLRRVFGVFLLYIGVRELFHRKK